MSILYNYPKLYDFIGEKLFKKNTDDRDFNEKIFKDMLRLNDLETNSVVMDLCCGTGFFTCMIAEERPDIHVLGLDISESMLEIARVQADEKQLKNVVFIKKNALELMAGDILSAFALQKQQCPLDMITCSFGFSAIEEYRAIFNHTLPLLKKRGCYVIMDAYYPDVRSFSRRLTFSLLQCLFTEASGGKYPLWQFLKDSLVDFEMLENRRKIFTLDEIVYIAKGYKNK